MKVCKFCNKDMNKIDHHNPELFDVYLCEDCLAPDYTTRYREIYHAGEENLLAVTVRVDEYYVVMNHAFNYTTKRTNFTIVYKNPIGEITGSLDLEPLIWDSDIPVCDFDQILNLPFHDPVALKQKLQVYILFS
jgi:hypothetical protein